jgi:hypothetical protein
MIVNLKENVVYESFENQDDMMSRIIKMIIESRTDKILFKGSVSNINLKTMRKVLLSDYTEKIKPELVRNMFEEFTSKDTNKNNCIIYKI